MLVVVTPSPNASIRTKTRLVENGPEFNLGRELPIIYFGQRQIKAILLHAIKNDWIGWVPSDEIIIE